MWYGNFVKFEVYSPWKNGFWLFCFSLGFFLLEWEFRLKLNLFTSPADTLHRESRVYEISNLILVTWKVLDNFFKYNLIPSISTTKMWDFCRKERAPFATVDQGSRRDSNRWVRLGKHKQQNAFLKMLCLL